eukprot:1587084-Alexandrium_andersonii.AAC.1
MIPFPPCTSRTVGLVGCAVQDPWRVSKAPRMAEEGGEVPVPSEVVRAVAPIEAEEAALAEEGVGEPVALRAEAALPAGWWRDPDGGATPTFLEGATLPA